MSKITKRLIDALRPDPAGKDKFAWDAGDGALKGFGVRVKPSGAASYLIQYRNREGRTRRLALARVGTVTPEEARKLARDRLAEAAKGADPSAERRAFRQGLTVGDLCDAYLGDELVKRRVKTSTLAMDRSRIERHVKPLIGKRVVASLSFADVEMLQTDIISGRTSSPRKGRGGVTTGGEGVASRTIGMLGTILEYGRKRKLLTENVARGIERPTEGRQKRFLSKAEIGSLGAAMRAAEAEGENPTALAAIRFLLLSGCRRMEALALPIGQADRAGGCIRFGDTKSGAQIRPVGAAAFDVLDGVPHRYGWAFPADRGEGHFVGVPRVLDRVCRRAGLTEITTHVLRHSFATMAVEVGFSQLTIAGLLGHSTPGVTARYAHVPDTVLVAAADRVAAHIAEAMAASHPLSEEKVDLLTEPLANTRNL